MCIAQQVKILIFFHPKYFFSPKNTANLFASLASLHQADENRTVCGTMKIPKKYCKI